ncbi:MAG: Sir2 family NAD-dependent protein deacetylase [Proteobacteria bacterium]|nr:Sir2 family NAD-dependent protein deacetylase [Pseudomonadota bacterium]MBU1450650.1 Sir2 family NAD-dependent protein deacetylase [Pseudomonadota bacterium]MBU2467107.1 Sir2 family NAD-dependent protein deacetylase [Pseudomonadota bacterium]MBU2518731.1 Sir2 family NAD-dependent protein deacetylase [Pseudomonadota bacterium]
MDEKIAQLADLVNQGGGLVVFSGAGMSTESGIPDYRSPGGIWSRHQPVLYPEFLNSTEARIDYWRFYEEWYPGFTKAHPNQGHLALGRLWEAGLLTAVITQNVDGLHQAGGVPSRAVVELHGNVFNTHCLDCGRHHEPTADVLDRFRRGRKDPSCPTCGGRLKPGTISFGQDLNLRDLELARHLCGEAKPLVVVGSSLAVNPAADLPRYTLRRNGELVIINRDITHLDPKARLILRRPAGQALAALADAMIKD